MGLGSPTQNSALGVPFQPMNHRQDADATSGYSIRYGCSGNSRTQMLRNAIGLP